MISSQIKWFIKSEKQYPEACTRERKEMGEICVDWIKNIWKPTAEKESDDL